MKMRSRVAAMVLAVLMCVALTSCGSGSGGSDSGAAGVKMVAKSLTPAMEESGNGVAISTTTDLVILNENGSYIYVTMRAMHPSWDIQTIGFNTVEYQMGTYTITIEDEYGLEVTLAAPDRVVAPGEYDESGFVVLSYADTDTADEATKASILGNYTERSVTIDSEKHTFTVG